MPVDAPPMVDELTVPVEPPVRVLAPPVPTELPPMTAELLLAPPELELPPVLLDPPVLLPPELELTPELMAPPDPAPPADAPPVPLVVEPSFEEQPAISRAMLVVMVGNQPRTLSALIMFSSWAWGLNPPRDW